MVSISFAERFGNMTVGEIIKLNKENYEILHTQKRFTDF